MRRVKVKICGITRPEDVRIASKLSVDALGFNFYPPSPRSLSVEHARSLVEEMGPYMESYAVFVDEPLDSLEDILVRTGIQSVQLHGTEPPETIARLAPRRVVRAFRWRGKTIAGEITEYLSECCRLGCLPAGVLIDTYQKGQPGGTGDAWNWSELVGRDFGAPVILAGGLNADNVGEAVALLRPAAVDVAGGVEARSGVKDAQRMAEFVQAVNKASATIQDADAPGKG